MSNYEVFLLFRLAVSMLLLGGLFEGQNLLIDLQDQMFYHPSTFEIHYSLFDILKLKNHSSTS